MEGLESEGGGTKKGWLLGYKVKAMSRESPSQKAAHVLDPDLRTHWSTSTNTKEWILLELNEPALLSHIRIHNKSVLEWEFSVGLRYKPETFVKVRPRCEAPRRDMTYPLNYTPCRYIRISCLRGNPIAIFFIQLIGVTVSGLEPDFQPVVNHLLPHIVSHKQDAHDMHLQLLRDMTCRLLVFLPQLEAELSSFSDAPDPTLRFLAMLAGPFYPILNVINERASAKSSCNISESEVSKTYQLSSALTVSSNFEPRRSRSTSSFVSSTSTSIMLRPDLVFMLLRKAYKDSDLGNVCRMASRLLQKLVEPVTPLEASTTTTEAMAGGELLKSEEPAFSNSLSVFDYSTLFGEEFHIPDDHWDISYLNVLDLGAVEEGILHVLYGCASQPNLCSKLASRTSEFWTCLPLVQALLPALRPLLSSPDNIDDSFSLWRQPTVQQALLEIVTTSSSSLYHPLLHACAGYLSSFSPSHAKAACVLIDLCCSVLAPWMGQVVAKVDLALELLEDLLGIIQAARNSITRARASLKYIVLAISGHVDDILGKYKEVKHRILFLLEMLEPFLDPAITSFKSTIAFGDSSFAYPEKQENNCLAALNVIRTAVQKATVLPYLECEWRRGSVVPSVLLSILEPCMQLPPDIDLRICLAIKPLEPESSNGFSISPAPCLEAAFTDSNGLDEYDRKTDATDSTGNMDVHDDGLYFAPMELRSIALTHSFNDPSESSTVSNHGGVSSETKLEVEKMFSKQLCMDLDLDVGFTAEYFNLQADYFQLSNYQDSELRASAFRRLALDLHSQDDITVDGHDAAIDSLLLAAECYVNPFFMMSSRSVPKLIKQINNSEIRFPKDPENSKPRIFSGKFKSDLETIAFLEKKRDKLVLQVLLEAAELDRKYLEASDEQCSFYAGGFDDQVMRLSSLDIQSADAVTLVRQNQALLCIFLINRLQKKQHTMHEILIQSLVFLLHSATRLYCSPEQVIDIILQSAEHLNKILSSLYQQLKEGNLQLDAERIYGIQRRWILLRRLVVASCCADEGSDHFTINKNSGFRYRNLIPPSAWTERITTFCTSALPLVRFLGWMAVSHNAKQYIKDRLFLASNLAELTSLLSIFADELAFVDNLTNQRNNVEVEVSDAKHASPITKGCDFVWQSHENRSFQVLYPDLSTFFPDMKKQFEAFGETILEAVGLQLRSLSSSVVPDILCWLSELCSWPFNHMDPIMSPNSHSHLKGYVSKNAKAIILYVLESIITEHIEAMVHEIPRVVQVLVSLCRSSYCDVSFLDSVMHLLKPIISYSLHKVCNEERVLNDDVCCSFESLCFSELLSDIKLDENHERSTDKRYCIGLTIYILASVLPDLTSQRRREMLQYLFSWADFAECQPTSSFYDYLCAFQCVMESCKHLLIQTLKKHGALQPQPLNDRHHNSSLKTHSWFLSDMFCASSREASNNVEGNNVAPVSINQEVYNLSTEEVEEFCKELEILISKLNKTVELCWNLHHKIAKKLIMVSVECFIYSRCLSSVVRRVDNVQDSGSETSSTFKLVDQFLGHWKVGLVGVAGTILMLQEKNCWEVASVMLDCLLGVPFSLDNVIGSICSAIKTNACSAPKLAWRLQTDKWLSILLARDVHSFDENNAPLVDLFCIILGHPEPEQRYVALQLLRKLVSQDFSGKMDPTISGFCDNLFSPSFIRHVPDSFLSHLVSSTWDPVVVLATYDISLHIRTAAMVLILNYIPFAPRHLLQSFLAVTDNLHGLRSLLEPNCEGPFVRISVALIAGACLYCPSEDIYLIPENVWRNIETMGFSRTGSRLGYLEKKACQALCRLKAEGDDAKEVLKEVLSASYSKEFDPDFRCTRESILEILADLTSVDSYFDIFSDKVAQDSMELEEAEIELDFIQKENVGQGSLKDSKDRHQIVSLGVPANEGSRLQQIKEQIHALERSKVQEEIAARRQKKLLMRHVRQKHLEEVAVHEAELLQELDREREAEAEKEIERQLLLEHERAKTRELRHNLDMEKEKQTQRELQRELEQAEAGLRPSRRDFSSSTLSSRPRERYRERENGRSVNEGSTRSSSGSTHPETSMIGSMATVPTILSGSRSFSSQLPTILQSRDRPDECGSSYEENIDGSKDSGDTGSVGDADSVSVFDGQSGGFGSSQRHGSRGSKSRQLLERREWEGRREGKWERKH